MAERKTRKKAAVKETEPKKETTTKRVCGRKAASTLVLSAENAGFKAGDVYQALAANGEALTVKEIAKQANITEEETLIGMGWLFKEGKIVSSDNKVTLA